MARITEDKRKQLLSRHLLEVAQRCSDIVPEQFRDVAYYAGLWHDLGKYRQEWQNYLSGKSKRIPHAAHGAMLAQMIMNSDKIPAIAYIIAGHHTELRHKLHLKSANFEEKAQGWEQAQEAAKQEIPNFIPEQFPDINLQDNNRREFAIRMLFSVLVDTDRLNAQIFESLQNWEASASCVDLQYSFNPHCFNPPSPEQASTEINRIRNVFVEYCISAAELPKGIFRLTGACGVGKTIASAKFARLHAKNHNMSGIVYVGPLKSIIEQTAEVYRGLFGETNVLEHHSGFEPKLEDVKEYKLNTERWDKPLIVTSGVQFYESLFANSPSKCRKLQGLINKVILIDEAQTIPGHLVRPILDVLNVLVQDWGCTVVLMSATQPAFGNIIEDNAHDIIPDEKSSDFFKQLNRVTYRFVEDIWSWADIAQDIELSKEQKVLIIVNTTKLAREGYYELSKMIPGNWFHLSSKMCPEHRSQVLSQVHSLLNPGESESCFLISTQVVEAGVDIDFSRVYRQLAPLDSLVQAAGRCNRQGLKSKDKSIVTVFRMSAIDPPGYEVGIPITRGILNRFDLNENLLEAINHYFVSYFHENLDGGQEIVNLINSYNFPEVAKRVSVIDDLNQISVVVDWSKGKTLVENLKDKDSLNESDWRQVQSFSVNVRPKEEKLPIDKLSNGLNVWIGTYNRCGIMTPAES
ncbi:CRISPR-associated helicase Cas3' [Nostoc sp. FACHB-973]|nr:CRISPR-associated helicase Cas3' [Nostoc sp. FACHB-973]